ncbi:hypothetical protein ACFQE0_04025 [Methylobacterium komagatae]|uniref:Uncharacterized protein n=1 Tax=Methylobacterium komagatae TaxID=374425 RepID=A0ABW2BH07_9HYPH
MRGLLFFLAGVSLAGALGAAPALAAPQAKQSATPTAPPNPVAASCTVPVPPPVGERPVKPALPQKPACLDAKEGCPGWEAYSFNDAVKAYNLQAQAFRPLAEAYLQKLNAYVKASSAYAQCEAETMQK